MYMGYKESKFLATCPLVLTLVWQTLICCTISPGSQRKNFRCYHLICYIIKAIVMLISLIWSIILYILWKYRIISHECELLLFFPLEIKLWKSWSIEMIPRWSERCWWCSGWGLTWGEVWGCWPWARWAKFGTAWNSLAGERGKQRREAETRPSFLETVQPREMTSVGKGADSDTF